MASQMIECYQFRCHFAESQGMACYLKGEANSGPISFEVQGDRVGNETDCKCEILVGMPAVPPE